MASVIKDGTEKSFIEQYKDKYGANPNKKILPGEMRVAMKAGKQIEINIPKTELHKEDVVGSVNGYAYQIKRGFWVKIPLALYEVLSTATTTEYTEVKRADGEGVDLIPHEVPRFGIQVKGATS